MSALKKKTVSRLIGKVNFINASILNQELQDILRTQQRNCIRWSSNASNSS
jgi:hypothetical protein